MKQHTPDKGRHEPRTISGGIYDHVLQKKKEKTILSVSSMEAKMDEDDITSSYDAVALLLLMHLGNR